jgi:2-polyprenyl-3-methyl-5-hydroxy-6-metoxy-1,4-benzoquinol methylase
MKIINLLFIITFKLEKSLMSIMGFKGILFKFFTFIKILFFNREFDYSLNQKIHNKYGQNKISYGKNEFIAGKLFEFEKKILKEDFALTKQKKILVLFCGAGRESVEYARKGMKVTGIDHSKELINLAREYAIKNNLNVKYILGNIPYSVKGIEKYDIIVISFRMFGALSKNDRELLLEKCFKCLKNKGILFLSFKGINLKKENIPRFKKLAIKIRKLFNKEFDFDIYSDFWNEGVVQSFIEEDIKKEIKDTRFTIKKLKFNVQDKDINNISYCILIKDI